MLIISGWGENSHRFGFQKGHLWSIVTNTLIVSERSSPVCPHLPHWLLLQRRACTALFWMFPDYLNASAWNILENQTLLWGRGSITLQAGKSRQMSWHFFLLPRSTGKHQGLLCSSLLPNFSIAWQMATSHCAQGFPLPGTRWFHIRSTGAAFPGFTTSSLRSCTTDSVASLSWCSVGAPEMLNIPFPLNCEMLQP